MMFSLLVSRSLISSYNDTSNWILGSNPVSRPHLDLHFATHLQGPHSQVLGVLRFNRTFLRDIVQPTTGRRVLTCYAPRSCAGEVKLAATSPARISLATHSISTFHPCNRGCECSFSYPLAAPSKISRQVAAGRKPCR